MATMTELHRATRRVVRQAVKQGALDITEYGSTVVKMSAARPRKKMTQGEVLAAFGQCKTKFKLSWSEIRALTRE